MCSWICCSFSSLFSAMSCNKCIKKNTELNWVVKHNHGHPLTRFSWLLYKNDEINPFEMVAKYLLNWLTFSAHCFVLYVLMLNSLISMINRVTCIVVVCGLCNTACNVFITLFHTILAFFLFLTPPVEFKFKFYVQWIGNKTLSSI